MSIDSIATDSTRRVRLYYEACIPASLMMLAAWGCVERGKDGWPLASSVVVALVAAALAVLALAKQWPGACSTAQWRQRQRTDGLRAGADDGMVWGTLLVPLVVLAKGCDAMGDWTAAVSLAMALALVLFSRSSKNEPAAIALFAAALLGLASGIAAEGGVAGTCLAALGLLVVSLAQRRAVDAVLEGLPRSFTLGEAAVGVQGGVLVAVDLMVSCIWRRSEDGGSARVETLCTEAAVVGLVAMACVLATIFGARGRRRVLQGATGRALFIAIVASSAVCALALVSHVAQTSVVAWGLHTLAQHGWASALLLLGYWAGVLGLAAILYLLLLPNGVSDSEAASKFALHVRRKAFHLLAAALFVPGLLIARPVLHVGLTVALAVFCVAECARALHVQPWATVIDQFVRGFTDYRDAGVLVTSHFYLLVGCAVPVWLGGSLVAQLAGVLALGVADAAASLVGVRFGRRRWPGTVKTLEGSGAFAASLWAAALSVHALAPAPTAEAEAVAVVGPGPWSMLVLCAALAVLEALTEQNDNLVVPLAMHAAAHVLARAEGAAAWALPGAAGAVAWAAPRAAGLLRQRAKRSAR
ncbi:dolichol kinase [Coemansia sp. Benny D115]|nr:dolichol kinase [Coemansia sp. Benny D115]